LGGDVFYDEEEVKRMEEERKAGTPYFAVFDKSPIVMRAGEIKELEIVAKHPKGIPTEIVMGSIYVHRSSPGYVFGKEAYFGEIIGGDDGEGILRLSPQNEDIGKFEVWVHFTDAAGQIAGGERVFVDVVE